MPPKSGAPGLGAGQRLISGETPTNASPRPGRDRRGADQLAGQVAGAGGGVGHQVHAGLVQMLAEALVIGEEESLVLLHGAAERAAELVALKAGGGSAVEEIAGIRRRCCAGIRRANRAGFGAGLGDDQHLRAGPLAVFGAVGIGEQVEFAHRVDAQQLLAGAAGLHVVFRRAGEFDAVQQEQILLRPVARHHEIVAGGGIGNADAAGLFPGEVDHAGVEREQFVITAAVERQVLHLPLAHQAGNMRGVHVRQFGVAGHGHLLAGLAHAQGQVGGSALARGQIDALHDGFGKAGAGSAQRILPHRQRGELVAAIGGGYGLANGAGLDILRRHSGSAHRAARLVRDRSRKLRRHLAPSRGNQEAKYQPAHV